MSIEIIEEFRKLKEFAIQEGKNCGTIVAEENFRKLNDIILNKIIGKMIDNKEKIEVFDTISVILLRMVQNYNEEINVEDKLAQLEGIFEVFFLCGESEGIVLKSSKEAMERIIFFCKVFFAGEWKKIMKELMKRIYEELRGTRIFFVLSHVIAREDTEEWEDSFREEIMNFLLYQIKYFELAGLACKLIFKMNQVSEKEQNIFFSKIESKIVKLYNENEKYEFNIDRFFIPRMVKENENFYLFVFKKAHEYFLEWKNGEEEIDEKRMKFFLNVLNEGLINNLICDDELVMDDFFLDFLEHFNVEIRIKTLKVVIFVLSKKIEKTENFEKFVLIIKERKIIEGFLTEPLDTDKRDEVAEIFCKSILSKLNEYLLEIAKEKNAISIKNWKLQNDKANEMSTLIIKFLIDGLKYGSCTSQIIISLKILIYIQTKIRIRKINIFDQKNSCQNGEIIMLVINNIFNDNEIIRNLSVSFLLSIKPTIIFKFFKLENNNGYIKTIIEKSIKTLSSNRTRESEKGSLFFNLLTAVYIKDKSFRNLFFEILTSLLSKLKTNVDRYIDNNYSTILIHGYFNSFTFIIKALESNFLERNKKYFNNLFSELIMQIFKCWNFEKINYEIMEIKNKENDSDFNCESLNQFFSYDWKVIKETSLLLNEIFKMNSINENLKFSFLDSKFLDCCNMIIERLFLIKHTGAFFFVYQSFLSVCEICSNSLNLSFYLESWLNDFFKFISEKKTSISRRSSGIPFIIAGILTTLFKKTEKTEINKTIDLTIEKLIAIAYKSIDSIDYQTEFPQVHAINCLKQVTIDLSTPDAIELFVEPCLILCFDRINSKNWSINNSFVMFFSAIIQKIFKMNIPIQAISFFNKYPLLTSKILTILKNSDQILNFHYTPFNQQLFFLLIIFDHLDFRMFRKNDIIKKIKNMLISHFSNKEWRIRKKISEVLSKMMATDDIHQLIKCFQSEIDEKKNHYNKNRIHSFQLTLFHYISLNFEFLDETEKKFLVLFHMNNFNFFIFDSKSSIISKLFIETKILLVSQIRHYFPKVFSFHLKILKKILIGETSQSVDYCYNGCKKSFLLSLSKLLLLSYLFENDQNNFIFLFCTSLSHFDFVSLQNSVITVFIQKFHCFKNVASVHIKSIFHCLLEILNDHRPHLALKLRVINALNLLHHHFRLQKLSLNYFLDNLCKCLAYSIYSDLKARILSLIFLIILLPQPIKHRYLYFHRHLFHLLKLKYSDSFNQVFYFTPIIPPDSVPPISHLFVLFFAINNPEFTVRRSVSCALSKYLRRKFPLSPYFVSLLLHNKISILPQILKFKSDFLMFTPLFTLLPNPHHNTFLTNTEFLHPVFYYKLFESIFLFYISILLKKTMGDIAFSIALKRNIDSFCMVIDESFEQGIQSLHSYEENEKLYMMTRLTILYSEIFFMSNEDLRLKKQIFDLKRKIKAHGQEINIKTIFE